MNIYALVTMPIAATALSPYATSALLSSTVATLISAEFAPAGRPMDSTRPPIPLPARSAAGWMDSSGLFARKVIEIVHAAEHIAQPVAIAAPAVSMPKVRIKIGSSTMLTTVPIMPPIMEALAAPSPAHGVAKCVGKQDKRRAERNVKTDSPWRTARCFRSRRAGRAAGP